MVAGMHQILSNKLVHYCHFYLKDKIRIFRSGRAQANVQWIFLYSVQVPLPEAQKPICISRKRGSSELLNAASAAATFLAARI